MAIIYNKNRKKGLFYIPSGGLGPSVSADFAYSKSSYNQGEADPTPTITGTAGGTFNASANVVFVDTGTFNSSTGQIDLSATTIDSHIITYTVDGVQSGQTVGVTAVPYASTSSFTFDGTDSYFDLGSPTALDFQTSEMSISFWINSNTASGLKGILGNNNASAGIYQYLIDIHRTVGKISFLTQGPPVLTSNLTINTNTWYHVCVTKSGTTSNWVYTMYINGSSSNGGTLITTTNPSATQSVAIGRYGALNAYYFSGNLDEFSFWNTALSQSAVTEIYNSGAPNDLTSLSNASNTNLKAWYKF